jgi:hypothetical protein
MGQVFTMKFDTRPLAAFFADLKKSTPVAVSRAINRTVATAQTDSGRAIAADMGLTVATAKAAMRVSKSTPTKLSGYIIVSGKRLPLIDFKAKGPEPSRGRGRGVSAISEGGRRKRYPNAFIARTKSGHRGVFQRQGTGRLPIFELPGASIAFVFAKLIPLGEAKRAADLKKNIEREMNFAVLSAKAS